MTARDSKSHWRRSACRTRAGRRGTRTIAFRQRVAPRSSAPSSLTTRTRPLQDQSSHAARHVAGDPGCPIRAACSPAGDVEVVTASLRGRKRVRRAGRHFVIAATWRFGERGARSSSAALAACPPPRTCALSAYREFRCGSKDACPTTNAWRALRSSRGPGAAAPRLKEQRGNHERRGCSVIDGAVRRRRRQTVATRPSGK
jgi:hypothetical protein